MSGGWLRDGSGIEFTEEAAEGIFANVLLSLNRNDGSADIMVLSLAFLINLLQRVQALGSWFPSLVPRIEVISALHQSRANRKSGDGDVDVEDAIAELFDFEFVERGIAEFEVYGIRQDRGSFAEQGSHQVKATFLRPHQYRPQRRQQIHAQERSQLRIRVRVAGDERGGGGETGEEEDDGAPAGAAFEVEVFVEAAVLGLDGLVFEVLSILPDAMPDEEHKGHESALSLESLIQTYSRQDGKHHTGDIEGVAVEIGLNIKERRCT
jgi:hypothetical protein